MKKILLKEIQIKLERQKERIEKELAGFAEKDPKLKSDWDAQFPKHNGGTGSSMLEDAADEVEEYATRLPIEFSLETKLRDIHLALGKMQHRGYGACEKCGKKIDEKRLMAYPEARICMACQKK